MRDKNKSIIELPQPKLLDFTKIDKNDIVEIYIENSLHRFSPNSEFSGKNVRKQPVFCSKVIINGELFTKSTFGLPFIKFKKNSEPKITYKNKTLFTFNIHYHGLNTVGSVDGTSMEVVFGQSTLLGPEVTFQFPKITNNQSLLWYHNHNMFISMELIYSGAVGLLEIVDSQTKWLEERFIYGDNHLIMFALDIDFKENGIQTNINLPIDQNRSAFTVINGISTICWHQNKNLNSNKSCKYENLLYHKTTDNLVKIDILNATLNWRVYHIGVCDEDYNIKSFYLIQSDNGLMNPQKLKMTFIPVAGRISILVDLDKFKNKTGYVFFYDYDLTEIFDSMQENPSNPNDPILLGTIPDFENKSQTSYPTPIPDPNEQNQQDNPTNLNYPHINQINQIKKMLQNGTISQPKSKNIKPFLKIIQECNIIDKIQNIIYNFNNCVNSIDDVIKMIRKTIYGEENYYKYENIISKPYFEYDKVLNYIDLLNKKYYDNIPKIDLSVPKRNFLLFPETNTNAIASGNVNGVTEYIDSANRIMVDLWNSNELDLNYAISQYDLNPNNYKPNVLPSSKFKIYKTNDEYSNTAMISNDTIIIEFFSNPIQYGDKTTIPVEIIKVVFQESNFLNIQEWINLANNTFNNINLENYNLDGYEKLSDILQCDWSFFPYQYPYMYNKNIIIKSAIIKTTNNSPYYIRILGRWTILQFFGKSMTGATLDNDSLSKKINIQNKFNRNNNYNTKNPFHLEPIKNKSQYIKCDEFALYGIYDADIQAFFPYYATSDGDTQLPIACMKRNGELIISENSIFKGFYDGYLNDNLNSFSVKLKSTELWSYSNGDNADNHPIHFHLTSGFALPELVYNSPGLLSIERNYNPLIYSRDIYQIGPQQTIGFYLTWPNYPSNQKTSSPDITGVGGVIHCHFLAHNDSNSMIIQYYIDP
jgi:FtsP/CotA-like multicopper oxidase with cupredoxin domain